MSEDKLDIFEVLNNINKKNYHYYDNLSDRMKSMFSPYLVYQWMTSTNDPLQLMLLDRLVSRKLFVLNNHKDLLYKLLCITVGNSQRYSWIYKKSGNNEKINVIAKYLGCSKREAKLHSDFFSSNDIKDMLYDMGYQDDEIKKLKL
jgi:hypothetical protein